MSDKTKIPEGLFVTMDYANIPDVLDLSVSEKAKLFDHLCLHSVEYMSECIDEMGLQKPQCIQTALRAFDEHGGVEPITEVLTKVVLRNILRNSDPRTYNYADKRRTNKENIQKRWKDNGGGSDSGDSDSDSDDDSDHHSGEKNTDKKYDGIRPYTTVYDRRDIILRYLTLPYSTLSDSTRIDGYGDRLKNFTPDEIVTLDKMGINVEAAYQFAVRKYAKKYYPEVMLYEMDLFLNKQLASGKGNMKSWRSAFIRFMSKAEQYDNISKLQEKVSEEHKRREQDEIKATIAAAEQERHEVSEKPSMILPTPAASQEGDGLKKSQDCLCKSVETWRRGQSVTLPQLLEWAEGKFAPSLRDDLKPLLIPFTKFYHGQRQNSWDRITDGIVNDFRTMFDNRVVKMVNGNKKPDIPDKYFDETGNE